MDDADLPVGFVQTEGTDPTDVTVTAGATNDRRRQRDSNVPGTVTGVVYNDVNGNGTQDAGEPGIENVEVTITGQCRSSSNRSDGCNRSLHGSKVAAPGTASVRYR
ncbi:SdrD B-like domain-containing protein [Nonlabens tegetincola]|uniref:SdrD B-like domain-containing protein n=1 Tax=Nonlabens tegetincola TaxID=323273 RepID=UPI00358EC769